MKIITIQNKKHNGEFIVDDEDYERIKEYKWFIQEIRTGHKRIVTSEYSCISQQQKLIPIANIILGVRGVVIDHKNNNPLDNRKENLRLSSTELNAKSRKMYPTNTTGFKGVIVSGYKYKTNICVNNKTMYVGTYSSKRLAAIAYDIQAIKYFGEYANTNGKAGRFKLSK